MANKQAKKVKLINSKRVNISKMVNGSDLVLMATERP